MDNSQSSPWKAYDSMALKSHSSQKSKTQAGTLCDHIPLIWRKDEALKDLVEKKKITHEVYQDLHNSFATYLTQLKKDAQIIIDESAVEIERCQEEITSLSYAIANLEIEHEIGKVDEENYKASIRITARNT